MGAKELQSVEKDAAGFLFGYQDGIDALRRQVGDRPNVKDRPEERAELLRLDDILARLQAHGVDVPTPRTWIMKIDDPLPDDLEFPLFVRTPTTSWKRGGEQGKVKNLKALCDEAELLRRAFGWDVPILARQWLEIASAGKWTFGNAPQEVRTWIVDRQPVAWSFHYLPAILSPRGFPPKRSDLELLAEMAARIAAPFSSRLMAADFVRDRDGQWHFLEAGPGAACGTGHEQVFKFVARRLIGETVEFASDKVGGMLVS